MASPVRQGRAGRPGRGQAPSCIDVRAASPQASALLPVPLRELAGMLARMRERAEALCRAGRCPGCPSAVELAVAGDGAMAALNRRAMGLPGPTNVLSFPARPLGGRASLALSSETLVRESLLYGQPEAAHLARLLAHGMGHVCGFDHGPAMDAFAELLEAAGLAYLAEAAAGELAAEKSAEKSAEKPAEKAAAQGEAAGEEEGEQEGEEVAAEHAGRHA